MNPVAAAVRRFLAAEELSPRRVLVAFSGGPDSTALLAGLAEDHDRGFDLVAGHVNHHLRGSESDHDEEFVRETAQSLHIPLEIADARLDPEQIRQVGLEAAARKRRYACLESMRQSSGSDLVATAHHLDDQAETVLMRLMTGSGTRRLQGISPHRGTLIRPILELSRREIDQFLADRGIAPRSDSTNREPRFLRNRIRAEILPLLEEINPRITSTFGETARQAREEARAFDHLLEISSAAWIVQEPNSTSFDPAAVPSDAWIVRAALLREIHRLDPEARNVSAQDLRRLGSELGLIRRQRVTRALELVREGDRLRLRHLPLPEEDAPFDAPIGVGEVRFVEEIGAAVRLRLVHPDENAPLSAAAPLRQCFQLPEGAGDASGFRLRNRRKGDVFRPLGSRDEKKLKDFLIDRKIPVGIRNQLPLLTFRDEIVWVAGVEVSDRFRVTGPPLPMYEIAIELRNDQQDD
ncbi:MAG: tRNA lysidine(34) synthetase TilS [Thermoanaerobaculia bacterium]